LQEDRGVFGGYEAKRQRSVIYNDDLLAGL
jgi:hypothetical protein